MRDTISHIERSLNPKTSINMADYEKAKESLDPTIRYLERLNPSVARNLCLPFSIIPLTERRWLLRIWARESFLLQLKEGTTSIILVKD